MAADPYEQKDLAADPASADVFKRMVAELNAYWGPLEKLVPDKLPPTRRGRSVNFTWPPKPWGPDSA